MTTKNAKKEPDEVELTYEAAGGERTATITLPIQPGRGERVLNDAERHGCSDIEALREQIKALYEGGSAAEEKA